MCSRCVLSNTSRSIGTCILSLVRNLCSSVDLFVRALIHHAGSEALPGLECVAEPGEFHHSLETFAFIDRCRKACKKDHQECQQNDTKRTLPPRLLRVEEHRFVLVDTDGLPKDLSYLALSYCWGSGRSLCTTSETVKSFRDGIDFGIVPAVLLDAAEVTRKLGEEYIWIDRLCIQQDDPVDWQQHALIMARIYEQAELTIAAVTSSSVHESFLRPEDKEPRCERASRAVPWPSKGKEQFGAIRIRVRPKSSDIGYWSSKGGQRLIPIDPYPLDRRGWTYQERYLAQRSVRYEPHQVVWECSTAQILEKFPSDMLPPVTRQGWPSSVQSFTERSLTVATDRSAAISGLASRHNKNSNEAYLAGFWQNGTILSQLLWKATPASMGKFCEMHSLSGAPSWSWLSIAQHVVYGKGQDKDEDFANIELMEIDVRPSGPNIFGDVIWPGRLVMKAKLLDATLRCQQQNPASSKQPKYKCTVQYNGRAHSTDVSVDTHLELVTENNTKRWVRQKGMDSNYLRPGSIAPVKIIPFVTAKWTKSSGNRSFAMVLSPLQRATQMSVPYYERMGLIEVAYNDGRMRGAMDKAETATFCIV
jgi:hypothetical protein